MSLLGLPPEVRRRILRELLVRPCPVDILFENQRSREGNIQDACYALTHGALDGCDYLYCKQHGFPTRCLTENFHKRWLCVGPLFSIEVLRICKQIYLEAIDVLYSENKFVLETTTLNKIPLSPRNLLLIKSLQLNILHLESEQSLIQYRWMITCLRLNPHLHLAIASVSNSSNKKLLGRLATSLMSTVSVRSCSVSLPFYPEVKALGARLVNQQTAWLFPRYNDLPTEIRSQILGYTDLVQDYNIQLGRLCVNTECCRHCSETLFPCCCNKPLREWPAAVATSRWSSRCKCKFSPSALLKVSSAFRAEALNVMFGPPSQFMFCGPTTKDLIFLRSIEPYAHRLRRIVLEIPTDDLRDWTATYALNWHDFVEFLASHCHLVCLSMTVIGSINDDHEPSPMDDPEEWILYQDFYRPLIPGFRNLIRHGLKKLQFEFLDHLNPMTDGYRKLVMSEGWIKKYRYGGSQ